MKVTTLILPVTLTLLLLITNVFASDVLSKEKYDKVVKSDTFIIDVKTFVFAKYGF